VSGWSDSTIRFWKASGPEEQTIPRQGGDGVQFPAIPLTRLVICEDKDVISFWDFVGMGRPQWRGQTSLLKAAFFLILGTPDMHTRMRNSHVINQIECLDLPPHSQVLEGGFGRAATLFWLARHHPNWRLTGVELDPLMAEDARRAIKRGGYPNIKIIGGSIEDLAEEIIYDLAISIDIMEHIEDDVGFLRRYLRALKPGGCLVLHVPKRHQEQWRLIPAFRQHHVRGFVRDKCCPDGGLRQVYVDGHVRDEYTVEELRQVIEKAGFKIVAWRETIGRWGEISFELNNLLWPRPVLRYLLALLTYPIAVPLGYLDVRCTPQQGNSFLVTAQPL
jgi:SAM-dependent methyltransferase